MNPSYLDPNSHEYRKWMNSMMKNLDRKLYASYHSPKIGTSPTSREGQNRFPYQEPQRDEQGAYYGYKILNLQNYHPYCCTFVSPYYGAIWFDGELSSDLEPSDKHDHGIHCTKTYDNPELMEYVRPSTYSYGPPVLVQCVLSGTTIVETQQGFRAQHAQITRIIGVYINEHWTSCQDYQKRALTYPRRIAEEESQRQRYRSTEEPWTDFYTYYDDPSSDS